MTTVPDHIKKNVRAVLLSKVGGILVSDFCKDYKSLLREQLNYKQLNFDNINDFIKAMPDVVRLEFSDKDMAYRMFGIVDTTSSYTPLVAKMAAVGGCSSEGNKGRRRNNNTNHSSSGSEKYPDIVPNMRGHYTLCYPRFKESDDATKESLEVKFSEFPGLFEVHLIPRMIFVRYTNKESCFACMDKYSSELNIRIAEEKCPSKGTSKNTRRDDDTIIKKNKSNDKSTEDGVYEVYIGNLASDVIDDDIQAMCSEFGPTAVRCCQRKGDTRKKFAFVDFANHGNAQSCISKYDQFEYKGNSLIVRLAEKNGPPQHNSQPQSRGKKDGSPQQNSQPQGRASVAPSGGKISWRSSGGQTSSSGASGITALDNNDESWDSENKSINASGSSSFGQSTLSTFEQSSPSFGQKMSSPPGHSVSFGQKTSPPGQSASLYDKAPGTNTDNGGIKTIYFGNLHSSMTQEDLTVLVKDFSPSEVRLRRDKNDNHKVFAFVVVSSETVANDCIHQFNQMDWNGRKINCRLSNKEAPTPKQNDVKTSPSEGSVSWKSGGKKDSVQNGGMKSLNNDDSWDIENRIDPNISNHDINKRFGSLSIQTEDCVKNQSAISPSTYQHTASKSPQKTSPKASMQQTAQTSAKNMKKNPKKQADFSDMPPLEPAVVDEMPPLERSIVEEMPLLEQSIHEYSDGLTRVWVGNFPYYETEEDLMYWFGPLGAVDIRVVNSNNFQKTTGAVVFFEDEETADYAIQNTHQNMYKGRPLWVQLYERDPEKRSATAVNLNISISAGSKGGRSVSLTPNTSTVRSQQESLNTGMKGAESLESVSSSHSAGAVAKSFRNLLHTYKIIMNKLGIRIRDVVYKPNSQLLVYVTSVYDEHNFWGQIIEDETTLLNLEETLETLQLHESKIGYTKGLGRCAAKIGDQWFRSWVVADRQESTVEIFNVDYGNTAVVSRRDTSLTLPDIWDLQPAVRPFRATGGTQQVNQGMEHSLLNVQVTGTNVDDTGFLTEVKVIGRPQ